MKHLPADSRSTPQCQATLKPAGLRKIAFEDELPLFIGSGYAPLPPTEHCFSLRIRIVMFTCSQAKNVFPIWNAISHRCICNPIMKHSSCQKPRLLQGLAWSHTRKIKNNTRLDWPIPVVIRVIRKNHEFTNTDAEQWSEVIIVVWLNQSKEETVWKN